MLTVYSHNLMMSDLKIILDRFFGIATQVCNETLAFQPDVVIVLMHSGRMPLYAGMELWQRTQQTPFPPIVGVNLGREKLKRFNELENRPGVTNCFIGALESDDVIAFFLAWLYDQTHWQEDLRACIQEKVGEATAPRILIIDELIHEGSTWLLTLGLLNLIYPKAEIQFYSANVEWKHHFFDAWIEAQHPELLKTDLIPPKEALLPTGSAREAGIRTVVGTEDIDAESLDWQTIQSSSANMELLSKYLPVQTWMELPRFVEQAVSTEIVARAGEYIPNLDVAKDERQRLQPSMLIMREIYHHGPITSHQIINNLGWSSAKTRYQLDRQVGRGNLVVKQEGRLNRYVLSPQTEPGYWHNHPLIDTYWALPGKLMAGELPGYGFDEDKARLLPRLRWLLDVGVTYFIDLSHHLSDRSETYENTLLELAFEHKIAVKYVAIPTPLRQLPRSKTIKSILELIDQALEAGHTLYIHDFYRGTTETILGCYFVQQGMSGSEALMELDRVRRGSLDDWRRAPAQERARSLVRKWSRPMHLQN